MGSFSILYAYSSTHRCSRGWASCVCPKIHCFLQVNFFASQKSPIDAVWSALQKFSVTRRWQAHRAWSSVILGVIKGVPLPFTPRRSNYLFFLESNHSESDRRFALIIFCIYRESQVELPWHLRDFCIPYRYEWSGRHNRVLLSLTGRCQ